MNPITRLSLFCVLITLVLMFSGCADAAEMPEGEKIVTSEMTTGAETTAATSEPVAESTAMSDDTTEPETNAEKQVATCFLISIFEVENINGKDALKADILSMLDGLERFRGLSEDDVNAMMYATDSYDYMIYDSYVQQDIENLDSFLFPTADIEGFTLSYASIYKDTLIYFFAPNDKLTSDDLNYNFDSCISIQYTRSFFESDLDKMREEFSTNPNYIYAERDGMVFLSYSSNSRYNYVCLYFDGGRGFTLTTPNTVTNDPDTLFDLAEKLRDSMELVRLD